jgi:hypothetical protein
MVPQKAPPGVDPASTGGPPTEDVALQLALIRETRSDEFMGAVLRRALDAGWSQWQIHRQTGLARDTIRDILARTSPVGD